MSSSNLVRWGALGAMLAGLGFVVAGYFGWLTRGQNDLAWAILAIALIGAGGGVVGLHARQRTSYGWLGTAGFAAAFAGSTLALIGSVILFLGVSGVLGGKVLGMGFGEFRLGLQIGLVILGIGLVLLGVATLRAKMLSRWVGVVLIVAFPAATSIAVFLAYFSGLVTFGFAWLALSYALRSERGETVQPPPRQSK